MPLAPGTRLGPCEISSLLGVGGMGEVYRATDTSLNREVAIKVLPAGVAGDSDRLARFRREAQVLAALNHPNIAAIYGLEEQGSAPALVMELVPGRTLAELLAAPLPIDEALPIAQQIAAALEAAHEQGIVHRDLKPANVKITDDGTVKVLDFGLAKALGSPGSTAAVAADQADSPTLTNPAMTEMGVILGTAGYMAPEQAKGRTVDRRADIWALGVVLFELLAGRALYRGETATETIAQLITQPPSWDSLPASVPAPVRRLLRRCLEKDPRKRLQSAGDARIEIDEILSGQAADEAAPMSAGAARGAAAPAWRRALPWAIVVALLALLGYQLRPRPTAPARPTRLDVLLTPGEDLPVFSNDDGTIAVLSPGGDKLVYLARSGTVRQLYLRRLDQLEATPLAGTEDAAAHFFSPDGASIGFFANGRLMRMSLAGGIPTPLAPAAWGRGGSWGRDNTIVFTAGVQEGLSRVSALGGPPVPVTALRADERTHRWPSLLPDGRHVLFGCQAIDATYDEGTIEAARIDTGERKVLLRGGTFPRYVGGHLVYSRGSTLYAARFDADALEVRGEPQPVLTGLLSSGGVTGSTPGGTGAAQISFADDGTAVYLSGALDSETAPVRLVVVDRDGRTLYEHPEPRLFRDPSLSPDGKQIAVRIAGTSAEHLHLIDLQRGTVSQITFDGKVNAAPVWSNDGRAIAYVSDPATEDEAVRMMPSDGSGAPTLVWKRRPEEILQGKFKFYGAPPSSFSPDDRLLAVSAGGDVAVVSLADGDAKPFPSLPGEEFGGHFSPDGRWMLFNLSELGIGDVYVRAYPGGGALRRVTTGGAVEGLWTMGGREIAYLDFTGHVTAVDVSPEGDGLAIGNPRRLFELTVAQVGGYRTYDAAADGSRFVLLLSTAEQVAARQRIHVTMVFDFVEVLRQATAGSAR